MDNENNNFDLHDISDSSAFDKESNEAIIKVIGVGGGGGNAVNNMYLKEIPGINFVVLNTDNQHLMHSPVPHKLLLGPEITQGRGAGNLPEVGRKCAEASADDIRALFNDQTEMVFITAGMGGGTGTGAAPVVAQIARDCGMLTIGIVTVPFMFEGEKKILKALEGANEMKKHVDALMVINNENLIDLYKDLSFFNAFQKADDTLTNAARSISEIISEPLYINVDFQDVKTILRDSGTAIISTGYGEGENRISKAIFDALHSPLLKAHDINTSKRLLIKFMCYRDSPNAILAEEINEITQFTSKLPSSIDVKWGIGDNPELGEKVKITVLASGFDVTLRDEDDESGKNNDDSNHGKVIKMKPDVEEKKEKKAPAVNSEEMENIYGKEKIHEKELEKDRRKYVVLEPAQFDDHDVIAKLEHSVAFNRDPMFKDSLKPKTEGQTQRPKPANPSDSNPDNTRIVF